MTMTGTPILERPRLWKCAACTAVAVTTRHEVHVELHPCPKAHGLATPMVQVEDLDDKVDAQVIAVEREDYAGDPRVSRWAAVRTEFADGSVGCNILAPTVFIRLSSTP